MNFKITRNYFVMFVFFSILGQFIWSITTRLANGQAQDFEVFYLSAKQVLIGENPYQRLGLDIIRNAPPALLFFVPLGLIPISISESLYCLISFIAFLIASLYLFKILKLFGEFKLIELWQYKVGYLTLCLLFFPLRHNLASGQVNNILLLTIVLAFWFYLKKKSSYSALILSIAICLKLTPIIIVVFLWFRRNYRIIIDTVLYLGFFGLSATILLGKRIWNQYFDVAESYFDLNISSYYNQAISGLLARTGHPFSFLPYIVILFSVMIFLYLVLKKTVASNFLFTVDVIIWNISVLFILLFMPFAWQYHYVIAIFPLFLTFYLCCKIRPSFFSYLVFGIAYILIGWNIKNPIVLKEMGLLGSIIASHVAIGGLILFFLNLYFFIYIFHCRKTIQC